MHKSRLGSIVIDCQTNDLDSAAEFWSKALGCPARKFDEPENDHYRALETRADDVHLLLQQVRHPSRVHIDIETDDVEAEARRLEKLGARRVEKVRDWWVMEAPTGQRFCVVGPQRSDFKTAAKEWA
jgi:predicted enzyme related to lactoylglutathione lyase